MIRIEDVFETPEVLYIILELYHSMKHSTSNISFIRFFLLLFHVLMVNITSLRFRMNGGVSC